MNIVLDFALKYVKMGIPVFPTDSFTKIPLTKNGHLDATTNEQQIRNWFTDVPQNYGVAIPTGALSGILVIDVDNKPNKDGFASLRRLEATYGELDRKVYQTTGSGGLQIFFKYKYPIGTVTNFDGFIGIDIRGRNGSATLPPSFSKYETFYTWAENADLFSNSLPEAPNWLVNYFLEKEVVKEERRAKNSNKSYEQYSIAELEKLVNKLKDSRYDDRESWLHVGMALHQATNGSDEGLDLWDSWSSQSYLYKLGECPQKWDGFYAGGGITVGTLINMVKEDSNSVSTSQKSTNVKGDLVNLDNPVPVNILQYGFNDDGFAKLFSDRYPGLIKYNWNRDEWLVYDTVCWHVCKKMEIKDMVRETVAYMKEEAEKITDESTRSEWRKVASKRGNISTQNNMLLALQSFPNIRTDEAMWDSNPFIFGCVNGVVDLKTGEFYEGEKELLISKFSPVEYDPTAMCPRWLQFLDEVFECNQNVINYVQKAIGYTLTGSIREQCFFMLIGDGRNGKSTLIKTIANIMGEYYQKSKFSTFERKSNITSVNNLAKLVNRRMTSASEPNQGSAGFDEGLLKDITGGEIITDRFLFQNEFDFMPTFKIWLGVNHAPRVRDDSNGFWRRIRVINFPVKFIDDKEDKELDMKLEKELPGILNWCIQGCLNWQKNGLKNIEEVTKMIDDYRVNSDPFYDFTVECLATDTAESSALDEIYTTYDLWCKAKGLKPFEKQSRAAMRSNFEKKFGFSDADKHRLVKGVKIVNDMKPEQMSFALNEVKIHE